MIQLSNIHFAYDKRDILHDVSLKINSGEIVGIVGPNGAGKSTLIKIISGLLKPSRGDVCIDEKEIGSYSAKELARLVAYVPQDNLIPFSYTAMEVVLMGRHTHMPAFGFESARDIQVAMATMGQTDCEDLAGRKISTLSGGERQRVILARSLAGQSKIMLLDEPTTFLDIKHQIGFYKILKEENLSKGTTIITATHDLNLASLFCDRIVMIKNGGVVSQGTPIEVVTAENIIKLYDVEMNVQKGENGRPFCLPV